MHYFSYSLIPIVLKLNICFGHGLKMCRSLGYTCNPQIQFCYFFHKLTLVVFKHLLLSRYECAQDKKSRINFFLFCVFSQFNLLVLR